MVNDVNSFLSVRLKEPLFFVDQDEELLKTGKAIHVHFVSLKHFRIAEDLQEGHLTRLFREDESLIRVPALLVFLRQKCKEGV